MIKTIIAFDIILFDNLNPTFGRLDSTHLNAGERIVELLNGGSHLFHAGREIDFVAVIVNFSYGRDDGSRAAKTAFGEILDLGKFYGSFLYFQTKIMLCYITKTSSRNRG